MVAVGCVLVRFFFGMWWWVVVFGLSWLCWASLPCLFVACKSIMRISFWAGGRGTTIPRPRYMTMIVFLGEERAAESRWVCHTHQIRRRSPYPLPAERCKGQPRKGVGDDYTATVLSHKFVPLVFVPPRGKCCPFFPFCVFRVWFGVFCRFFAVLLFLGSLFEKFSGANFCFLGVGVGRVFFGGFSPMFLLYFLAVRSRKCLEKFS